MKVYLCNEVIRGLDFGAQCRFARETGYDGLEVAPFTLSSKPDRLTSAEIASLRNIAVSEGVELSGLHWLLAAPEGLSITSSDAAVSAETLKVGKRLVSLCAELGGSYLVHGSPLQRQLEPGREAEGRKRGIDFFAAMGAAAEEAGVRYIIEPLSRNDTRFVNSTEDALAIIESIGSKALATMIDCYATASNGEDIVGILDRLVPQGVIAHVHFNDDNKRGPGEGATDFASVVDTLLRLDYPGTTAVEPFIYQPDGCSCAARSIGFIKGLMERHH